MNIAKNVFATLALTAFVCLSGIAAKAQSLPNQDFENWKSTANYQEPVSWGSTNQPLSTIPGNLEYTLMKTTDAYSGTYAALLQTRFYSFIGKNVPGVLTNGIFSLDNQMNPSFSGGSPISTRPARLQFWYKYAPAGQDSFGVFAYFMKRNSATGKRDTIGKAGLRSGKVVNSYTLLELPIQYSGNVIPDTVLIIAVTSDVSDAAGSKLYIDNIGFSTMAGISPTEKSTGFEICPNPANDYIHLSGIKETSDIRLTDMFGRTYRPTIARKSEEQIRIELDGFTPGIYFITITNNSELITRTLVKL